MHAAVSVSAWVNPDGYGGCGCLHDWGEAFDPPNNPANFCTALSTAPPTWGSVTEFYDSSVRPLRQVTSTVAMYSGMIRTMPATRLTATERKAAYALP